jgi:DNA polymerase (family X)
MMAIDALNPRLRGITLLKGVEVDVLEDGSLALPDEVLAAADVVVAAVHGHFDLGESRQTERMLRVVGNPLVHILAHPSGRLIGKRHAMAIDMERVCRAARQRPCYLELNGQPERLDIDDVQARMARDHGVLVSIASDAHHSAQFDNLQHGVTQARRGWLTAADVLNTRPLAELLGLLGHPRR